MLFILCFCSKKFCKPHGYYQKHPSYRGDNNVKNIKRVGNSPRYDPWEFDGYCFGTDLAKQKKREAKRLKKTERNKSNDTQDDN